MRASAFVPGHITGFFKPFEEEEPLRSGSIGCGVVISKGVKTEVAVEESDASSIKISLNGNVGEYPVSSYVVNEILGLASGSYDVEVFHECEVPISQGFGASAAAALGTAIAMSKALEIPLTLNKCGEIAHKAEIFHRTGLGDVIAQCNGGLAVRLAPGSPGVGVVDRIPCDLSVVSWIVGPPLKTREVLEDEKKKTLLASVGWRSMDELLKHPDAENFMSISRRFADDSGLMSKSVRSAVKILDEENITASMVMLGNAIFTLTRDFDAMEGLLEHPMIVADIDESGGRLL
jgi:pantoate kinase